MDNPIEKLLVGILVIVVLFGTYALGNYFSRRRVEQDFENPGDILTAVDIYVRYGRKRAAIKLLQHGLERHPNHPELTTRLAELHSDQK